MLQQVDKVYSLKHFHDYIPLNSTVYMLNHSHLLGGISILSNLYYTLDVFNFYISHKRNRKTVDCPENPAIKNKKYVSVYELQYFLIVICFF